MRGGEEGGAADHKIVDMRDRAFMPRFSWPVHASLSADIMPQAAPSCDGHRRTRAWLAWAAVEANPFLPFCRHSDTGRKAWDSEWVWEIWGRTGSDTSSSKSHPQR